MASEVDYASMATAAAIHFARRPDHWFHLEYDNNGEGQYVVLKTGSRGVLTVIRLDEEPEGRPCGTYTPVDQQSNSGETSTSP